MENSQQGPRRTDELGISNWKFVYVIWEGKVLFEPDLLINKEVQRSEDQTKIT